MCNSVLTTQVSKRLINMDHSRVPEVFTDFLMRNESARFIYVCCVVCEISTPLVLNSTTL